MSKQADSLFSRLSGNKNIVVFSVVGAVVGLFLLVLVAAQEQLVSLSVEGEAATLSNGASNVSDENASGDFYVGFFEQSENFVPAGYDLVWSDEFDGDTLDETKWGYQRGTWGAARVQNCYIDEASTVRDGSLVITSRHQPDYQCFSEKRDFTSGFVQTRGKHAWTYGFFVARIKMPDSDSTWPAFWMSPNESVYGSWPRSGEIDVTEIQGHNMNKTNADVHWGESGSNKRHEKGEQAIDDATQWHDYAVEWSEGELKYYVDGVHFHTVNDFKEPNATDHPGPFNIPFYLRLNVAVGGTYLDKPYDDANNSLDQLPAEMLVDWVRVYQRS